MNKHRLAYFLLSLGCGMCLALFGAFRDFCMHVQHSLAAILPAIGAGMVAKMVPAAVAADAQPHGTKRVMRAAVTRMRPRMPHMYYHSRSIIHDILRFARLTSYRSYRHRMSIRMTGDGWGRGRKPRAARSGAQCRSLYAAQSHSRQTSCQALS